MRINCAHDSPPEWRAMCENLRRAQATTGRDARVACGSPWAEADEPDRSPRSRHATRRATTCGCASATGCCSSARAPDCRDAPTRTRSDASACSLGEAFAATHRGHHVWFDDGKLGGLAETVDPDCDRGSHHVRAAEGSQAACRQGHQPPGCLSRHRPPGLPQRGRPAVCRRVRRPRRAVVRQSCVGGRARPRVSRRSRSSRAWNRPEDRDASCL